MTDRGVICKIFSDHYYLLSKEGDFIRIAGNPPPGTGVGSRIAIPRHRRWPAFVSLAAALALVVLASILAFPGSGVAQDNMLAIQFNPGVELAYDGQFTLTGWRGLNDQGQTVVEAIDLEAGQGIYLALEQVLDYCQEQGLLSPGQTVMVTSGGEAPDEDLLLGALEGRGLELQLFWLFLERKSYNSDDAGPLHNYLRQQDEELALESTEAVLAAARELLPGKAVEHKAAGWFDNPVRQHLVERHRISHNSIQWMQEQGLDAAQIAAVAEQARTEGKSPRQVAELLLAGGEVAELDGACRAILEQVVANEPALEYLGDLFDYSPGRLTSLLARGLSNDDISLLLLLERSTGSDLDQLLAELEEEAGDVPALARKHNVEELDEKQEEVNEKVESIGKNPDREQARELAREYGVPPGQAMGLLADGYNLVELEELLMIVAASDSKIQDVLCLLGQVASMEELFEQLGIELPANQVENIAKRIGSSPSHPGRGRPK